jgi:hypothetical protein
MLAASVVIAASATAALAQSPPRAHLLPHTTAPDLYVNVRVTMTNTRFIVSRHSGPRGADAKFELHNTSNKPHNFSIGNEKYGTGVQTGFTVTLKPGQSKILVLFLDIRGTIRYFPGLPADKGKKGMSGIFKIGPCTAYEQNTGVGEC